MENETEKKETEETGEKPVWYKTKAGIASLAAAGVVLIGIIGYAASSGSAGTDSTEETKTAAVEKSSQKSSSAKTKLLVQEAHLEYGDSLDSLKNELVQDADKYDVSFDESTIDFDTSKKTPEVGEYTTEVFADGESLGTVKIYVSDTTAPVFAKASSNIQIDEGSDFSLASYFDAVDASAVTLETDIDQAELKTVGSYAITVTATDAYGNKSSVQSTVHVIETDGMIEVSPSEGTVVDGILIVNKKNPVSAEYAPGEDPEAVAALKRMISDMQDAGLDVSDSYSGYRTYETQKSLYENYVLNYGKDEADTFSARPGYSEHQTGLAFDLKNSAGELLESSKEAAWIQEHCAEYGFIIRFPDGKEDITGYMYEPWHVRYVGSASVAAEIMDANSTLEEYLSVEGGDYK
jgi:LAS superfamily LD-carboxypeptidase LdcB